MFALWPEALDNVWKNTASCHMGVTEEFVELIVISDCELKVAWSDTSLAILLGALARQIKHLKGEVLEDTSHEDTGTESDTLSVSSSSDSAVETADWEDEASSAGVASSALFGLASLSL